jgi:hypothetical protein
MEDQVLGWGLVMYVRAGLLGVQVQVPAEVAWELAAGEVAVPMEAKNWDWHDFGA